MKKVQAELEMRAKIAAYENAKEAYESQKANADEWRKAIPNAEQNVEAWQQEKKNWSRAKEEDGTVYFWNTKTDETSYEEPYVFQSCQEAVIYLYNLKTKATQEEAATVAYGYACIEAGKNAEKDVTELEKEVE